MSGENVQLWAEGILAPGASAQWFEDYAPIDYNRTIRRVRTYSAVPFVVVEDEPDQPNRPLSLPPDPPWPNYEQRIAVTEVFYLLKATPTPPPGVYPPNAPALQVNVVITNLMPDQPVTYRIYIAETDN
jgi:hypothetical protein